MASLTELYLSHNKLEAVPAAVGRLEHLVTLSLANNTIKVWLRGRPQACVCWLC